MGVVLVSIMALFLVMVITMMVTSRTTLAKETVPNDDSYDFTAGNMDMSWDEAKDWCQTQGRQLACWIGLNCIDNESGHWVSNVGSDSENSEKLQSDNQFDSAFCVEMSSVLDGVWTGKSC